jgi:xanthine dehydrogenase molybdopterin-binding subunit B
MIQIASSILNIPEENIFISETSTDKTANQSATGKI